MRKLEITGSVVGLMLVGGFISFKKGWIEGLFSIIAGKKRDVHQGWERSRQYGWTGRSWLNHFTTRPWMGGERFSEES